MSTDEWPEHLAVMVLLPDVLRSGGIERVGRSIALSGVRPVRVASVRLDASHAATMYRGRTRAKTSAKGRVFGGILTRRLFALDSSLVVLLRRDRDAAAETDLSQWLHDVKGPSAFLQLRPDSLRALSRSSDRCLSLVHTPDDARDAADTAALFFRDPAAQDSIDGLAGCSDAQRWTLVRDCRAMLPLSFDTSRYAIVVCSLLRCVALSLADGTSRPQAPHAVLASARRELSDWLAEAPAESPESERKRFGRLIEALGRCEHALPSVVNGAFSVSVAALLSLDDYDLEWAEHIVAEFARHGLHMTDAEVHSLGTLMTFFDD